LQALAETAHIEATIAATTSDSRYRVALEQFTVEMLLRLRREPEALEHLIRAKDAGLLDIVWLEHCPVLAPVREEPRFTEVLSVVRQRVEEILSHAEGG
jgi:eukaryotic-like serine/threonine-protein kinase